MRKKMRKPFLPLMGFCFAVTATLVNILYLGVLLYNFSTFGMAFSPPEPTPTLAAIASILGAQLLIILTVILRRDVEEDRRVFAELSIVFMVLLSAMTSANRCVHLSILPALTESADAGTIALLHSYIPTSFMWGIENFGWDLFFGLGALFLTFAFSPEEQGLRWMFGISSVMSLLHGVGFIVQHPVLTLLGFPAWGIFLPIGTVLPAIRFWRRRDLPSNASSTGFHPRILRPAVRRRAILQIHSPVPAGSNRWPVHG